MKPALLLLLLSTAAHADDWTGPDKGLHAVMSGTLAGTAYTALPMRDDGQRALASFAVVVALGVAKEAFDATTGGTVSGKDIAAGAAGAAVGVGVAWLLGRVFQWRPPAPVRFFVVVGQ